MGMTVETCMSSGYDGTLAAMKQEVCVIAWGWQ